MSAAEVEHRPIPVFSTLPGDDEKRVAAMAGMESAKGKAKSLGGGLRLRP